MLLRIKIIAILLLVTVGLGAQGTSSLLEKKLSLSVQNRPIQEVLKLLEKAGDFTVAYSNRAFNGNRKVSIEVVDQSLKSILDQIFPNRNLRYRQLNGKLLIYQPGDTIKSPAAPLYQTVRGRVIDEVTNQPIPGANVIVPGSDPIIGASTGSDGRFKIERVPVGRHNFQVTFMGYLPKVLPGLAVDAGKEVVLNVILAESVTELEAVVVTAELDKTRGINEMALISAKSFSVEETSRYAGSFNDPARMATSYAGVIGSNDDTENAIIVRGNSPRGLLWRLEGMEIPNPNHFASDGASNGAINMLNANVMTNSDFLTGAFPAEYGNAFSGVFDMKLRNGNNESKEYAFQAGLLGIEASLEGPFKRKEGKNLANASYLINYRYSTITLLENLGLNLAAEGARVPAFQDISFKFNIPTATAGTFSFYGLGGISDSNDLYTQQRSNNQQVELDDREKYQMGLTGLNHTIPLGKNSFLETGLSYSRYDYEFVFEGLLNDQIFLEDIEEYTNAVFRASSTLNTRFSSKHSTKFGIIYTLNTYDLGSRGFFFDGSPNYASDEDGSFGMYQAFVSHKFRVSNELTLTGGFHYLRLALAGQDSFEPRLALRWQFKPDQALSFGFGMHSRKEETSLYFTDVTNDDNPLGLSNSTLDLARARHYVLGYSRNLGNNLNLHFEAYYQDLYNIPVSAVPGSDYSSLNQDNAFQRQPLINEGSGQNYGVEFTLEKFMSQGYFFLFTGTLYESNFKTLTNIRYNTRYNGKYNFNLVGGKEIPLQGLRNRTLNIGAETVFGGGNRVQEIDLAQSITEGRTIFAPDAPFARQLKDYFRLDFQISLKTNRKKSTHELKLDVQNLTSRNNVTGESFSAATGTIRNTAFTGEIIPVLSYKITF